MNHGLRLAELGGTAVQLARRLDRFLNTASLLVENGELTQRNAVAELSRASEPTNAFSFFLFVRVPTTKAEAELLHGACVAIFGFRAQFFGAAAGFGKDVLGGFCGHRLKLRPNFVIGALVQAIRILKVLSLNFNRLCFNLNDFRC